MFKENKNILNMADTGSRNAFKNGSKTASAHDVAKTKAVVKRGKVESRKTSKGRKSSRKSNRDRSRK